MCHKINRHHQSIHLSTFVEDHREFSLYLPRTRQYYLDNWIKVTIHNSYLSWINNISWNITCNSHISSHYGYRYHLIITHSQFGWNFNILEKSLLSSDFCNKNTYQGLITRIVICSFWILWNICNSVTIQEQEIMILSDTKNYIISISQIMLDFYSFWCFTKSVTNKIFLEGFWQFWQ